MLTVPFMFGVHVTADFQCWTEDGLTRLLQQRSFQIALVEKAGGISSAWRKSYARSPISYSDPIGVGATT